MTVGLDLGECQVCESEPGVGVAAVPGAPVSVVYGEHCLAHHAVPLWIADFNIGDVVPFDDVGWHHVAEWFREQTVYLDGEYKRVDELTMRVDSCPACGGKGVVEDGDGVAVTFKDGTEVENACMLCYRGRIVTILPEVEDGD